MEIPIKTAKLDNDLSGPFDPAWGSAWEIAWPKNRGIDRKSTRLNSSHTEIYTLSLHDALPIYGDSDQDCEARQRLERPVRPRLGKRLGDRLAEKSRDRSEEHTSELQSHRDLHSFPTRRSSDLWRFRSRLRSSTTT